MAEVAHVPAFVVKLLTALEEQFPGAKADVERVRGLDSYAHRIVVTGDAFDGLDLMMRHDRAWAVAERELTREQRLRVSMIVCLTPDELLAEE